MFNNNLEKIYESNNDSDNINVANILNILLNDIYSNLKQKDLFDDIDLRFKFLYICRMVIEESIKENDNTLILNKILSLKLNKKDILLEYSKYTGLDEKSTIKEAYTYYIDMYTNSYEGSLDKTTVKGLYTIKYDNIFKNIDDNNFNIRKIKKQIVNNFYFYKNTIRGYERKEFKKNLLRARELIKLYENTLSKEDLMMIRKVSFNLINAYITDDKMDSFDNYFVSHLLSFDLEQAKEISLNEKKYKNEYKLRNVLVK